MANGTQGKVRRSGQSARATARLAASAAIVATPVVGALLGQATWALALDVTHALASAPTLSLATVTIGEVLTVVAGAAGAVTAAHLTLMSLVLLASPRSSRARRAAVRLTPAVWRRVVGAAAAGTLSAGLAVPAMASPSASDAGWISEPIEQAQESPPRPLHPPLLPALTTSSPDSAAVPATAPPATDHTPATSAPTTGDPYVVATGDSLWSITADALSGELGDGEASSDVAAVAQAWPDLYEENRAVVGADASLIHPGTELVIPEDWAR